MSDRATLVVAVVLGWVLLSVNTAVLQPWTLDDAYISMRYAEHLAEGLGPVYNPGERVEGYTCFLWVALLAMGPMLGMVTEVWAKALGFVLTAGCVLGAGLLGRQLLGARGAWAATLTGGSTILTVWAMSGMEVPLVSLCVLATAAATLSEHPRALVVAGLTGALACMSRPDAAVAVGVLLLAPLARRAPGAPLGPAVALGVYGPYFAWRWAWYGWFLPNTFYAKVGATRAQVDRGLEYVGGLSLDAAPLLCLVAGGALLAARQREPLVVLGAVVGAQVLYCIGVGGDVMPAYRFVAPLVPLMSVLAVRAVGGVGEARGLGLLMLVVGASQVLGYSRPALFDRVAGGNVGRNGREVGEWLAEHVPADTWLATNTAGSVPYFSRLPTIDMLGLNDATIAHAAVPRMGTGKAGHEKADAAYVLSRGPALVMLGSARGSAKAVFRSDRQLVADVRFERRYVLRKAHLPSGAVLRVYVQRARADLLAVFEPPP